jgi:hypothetical protein
MSADVRGLVSGRRTVPLVETTSPIEGRPPLARGDERARRAWAPLFPTRPGHHGRPRAKARRSTRRRAISAAGIGGDYRASRAFQPSPCGVRRARAGASGHLSRDEGGMLRCLSGKRRDLRGMRSRSSSRPRFTPVLCHPRSRDIQHAAGTEVHAPHLHPQRMMSWRGRSKNVMRAALRAGGAFRVGERSDKGEGSHGQEVQRRDQPRHARLHGLGPCLRPVAPVGTIKQAIVDVFGEPYVDLEKEALALMKRE